MPTAILIVDDDPIQRRLLSAAVERLGHQAVAVDGGQAALDLLNRQEGEAIALIVLDLVMPDVDGMAALAKLRELDRSIPVIVQTAHGGIDTVVSAMRAGAVDFVVKPVSAERLQVSIENALKLGALEGELARMKRVAAGTLTFREILTHSPAMERVIRLGQRAAASQIPILIEGESGVGKELIARAIQGGGDRKSKPFVTVNCGAIPDNLVESILFGHEKGAFTGAIANKIGRIEQAAGGTLFLDEIGEMSPLVQAKFLRVLEEREFQRVGGTRTLKADVRVIAATNRDLAIAISRQVFREDLFYRLNVFQIPIAPLRRRPEDILPLADAFLEDLGRTMGRPAAGISHDAREWMLTYPWPGNVRELRNAIERAILLCDGGLITHDHFPVPLSEFEPSYSGNGHGGMAVVAEHTNLEAVERDLVESALGQAKGNKSKAARLLGISRAQLYHRIEKHGLSDKD